MVVIKRQDGNRVKREISCLITLGPFALAHGTHLRAHPHIHDASRARVKILRDSHQEVQAVAVEHLESSRSGDEEHPVRNNEEDDGWQR